MRRLNRQLLCAVLSGLFISVAPLIAFAEMEKVSERCALCHEAETKEWAESKHAQALGGGFRPVWEREGKKWECLVCHTSTYDRKSGEFSEEGVGCISCHGPVGEDHPEGETKTLPVTSEACQACHGITFGEWRISAHGQKDIRCFDCHKMHGMQTRTDDPDQMCGACHTERLEGFEHATHAMEGLHCITCHMPDVSLGTPNIKGTGVRGHTFGVGAETCAGCHREMVHTGGEVATLEKEVRELRAASPQQLTQQVDDLRTRTNELQQALHANRRVFGPVVAVAFGLGLVIGTAVPHLNRKHREGK